MTADKDLAPTRTIGSAPSKAPKSRVGNRRVTSDRNRVHRVRVLGLGVLLKVSGTRDQRIAQIAGRQRGRVARRQLLAAGVGHGQIQHMLRTGRLYREHHGVYAVGHRAPTELAAEAAALLAAPECAALSHRSAAALWGLLPTDPGAPIDLTITRASSCRKPGIVTHRTRHLPPCDVRVRHGIPVTSVARTLLDVAECGSSRELERALDEALGERIVRLREIRDVLDRLPNRRGAGRVHDLLDQRRNSTLTRSEAEERFLALIRAAQLPPPEVNVPLLGFIADFFWREQNLVVEVDGYQFHSTKSAFERDRRKDGVFRAAAIDVHRITWEQIEQEPFALVARVAFALEAARARRAA